MTDHQTLDHMTSFTIHYFLFLDKISWDISMEVKRGICSTSFCHHTWNEFIVPSDLSVSRLGKQHVSVCIAFFGYMHPGGPLECQGGYQARPKIHVIRVVFQDQAMYACTAFSGAETCKIGKKGVSFGHIDKFWKGHDRQIKKNACKNEYVGSIFIPKKYVIRVLFVSPWTCLIPPQALAIRVPPRACTYIMHNFMLSCGKCMHGSGKYVLFVLLKHSRGTINELYSDCLWQESNFLASTRPVSALCVCVCCIIWVLAHV